MSDQLRDRLRVAAEAGFEPLRSLTQSLLDDGASSTELVAEFERVRALVDETVEDVVLDVMDLLVGWCAPSAALKPSEPDR